MKILLATDGTRYSNAAVEMLSKLNLGPNDSVRVVSVVDLALPAALEMYGGTLPDTDTLENDAKAVATAVVEGARDRLATEHPDAASNITVDVLFGSPERRIVEAADRYPTAATIATASGVEGAAISFTGSGTDPDAGDVLSYEWHFGDGSVASSAAATHTYANDGVYAAQFIVTSGPAQRPERWWRRSAISSLPVPRSPITSTGRFNGAARLARSTASRKARLDPTNWLVRSTPIGWCFSPSLGKKFHAEIRAKNAFLLDYGKPRHYGMTLASL